MRILAGSGSQRARRIDGLNRAVDAVVLLNACQVPLDHLRDGISMVAVHGLQLRDVDLE